MNSFDRMRLMGVVPVIAIEDAAQAVKLGQALIDGGINIVEITFRTEAALQAIKNIKAEVPNLHVGAGTVLNVEQVRLAHEVGCEFVVSPGFSEMVVTNALELGLDVLPGVVTPTEIMQGVEMGLKTFKFFPAESYGGIKTIKALSAPFGGLTFVPTGGIRSSMLKAYLEIPEILAVGGTWLATKQQIKESAFGQITKQCRDAMAIVKEVRANG